MHSGTGLLRAELLFASHFSAPAFGPSTSSFFSAGSECSVQETHGAMAGDATEPCAVGASAPAAPRRQRPGRGAGKVGCQ